LFQTAKEFVLNRKVSEQRKQIWIEIGKKIAEIANFLPQ
jgi:hypothetical protein